MFTCLASLLGTFTLSIERICNIPLKSFVILLSFCWRNFSQSTTWQHCSSSPAKKRKFLRKVVKYRKFLPVDIHSLDSEKGLKTELRFHLFYIIHSQDIWLGMRMHNKFLLVHQQNKLNQFQWNLPSCQDMPQVETGNDSEHAQKEWSCSIKTEEKWELGILNSDS